MEDFVKIDGSMGEGGGQVLRTALSLSAITGTDISIEKIRAGREKPGLKRQHLTCVRAVGEICGAKVSGDEVGSRELEFAPGKIKAGDYRFDVGTAGSVTLVAQTVIPVLLKADAPSTVMITGGTHVPFAPIWEFFAETYLPELRRMGAKVEAELVQLNVFVGGRTDYTPGLTYLSNWSIDIQKETMHYLTNRDVIGAFHLRGMWW